MTTLPFADDRALAVSLPLAPSLNNAYVNNPRTRGRYASEELKTFKAAAVLVIRNAAQHSRFSVPERGRFSVRLVHWFSSRRSCSRSDIDNRTKAALDAAAAALGFNDHQIDELYCRRGGVDTKRPRTELIIEVLS